MYEPRTYRRQMENGRFSSFTLREEETDLWIGVNDQTNFNEIRKSAKTCVSDLRKVLKDYIDVNPDFLSSHKALAFDDNEPAIIKEMKIAAIGANTGPMAAVAGITAMNTLINLDEKFNIGEIVIENGGDIAIKIEDPIVVDPFAGKNKYFGNLGIEISNFKEKLAICSSSGIFGHSLSYGKADLVVTVSRNAALADAWATSLANDIQIKRDVEKVTRILPSEIIAVMAVKDDKMAYRGPFSLVRI